MAAQKVVMLDGRRSGDEDLMPAFTVLGDTLKQGSTEVQVFSLREQKLAHCIGCFACWLETPGLCRYRDAGQGIVQAIAQSDTIILFTPVVFGGYSSQLKQVVDRFLPLLLPYFCFNHGEIHHRPRYARYPRWVCVGVQRDRNSAEAELFKLVVGRNALNFYAPSYAAEVVQSADDPARLQGVLRSLLDRKDQLPWGPAVRSMMPAGKPLPGGTSAEAARRALLVVASPKTLSASTSGVLGNEILTRLEKEGWAAESLTLKPSVFREQGLAELLEAVDRADLLLFAFPLYVDALPYLMARALEAIADHRRAGGRSRPQALCAIANNGFPESHQNHLALSICARFAEQSGLTWLGGLAMGAGETISGGQPLKPKNELGIPLFRVFQALDAAGRALARGESVPAEVWKGLAKPPIPYFPAFLWHWMFIRGAAQYWQKRAARHGVGKAAMLAKPLGAVTEH